MENMNTNFDDGRLQMIAFRIAQQDYCFDIKRVREIRGWTPATPLPCARMAVLGMINLRGMVIPVIDLSARMGFGPTTPCSRHAILVVEIGNQIVGMLVDAVSEILTIERAEVQATSAVGASCADRLVAGVISNGERIVTVLELDEVSDLSTVGSLLSDSSTVGVGPSLVDTVAVLDTGTYDSIN
jgi:purine-binding chemotaxis protein CheW